MLADTLAAFQVSSMFKYMYVCVCVRMCVCVRVYVCAYVRVCVFVYHISRVNKEATL